MTTKPPNEDSDISVWKDYLRDHTDLRDGTVVMEAHTVFGLVSGLADAKANIQRILSHIDAERSRI